MNIITPLNPDVKPDELPEGPKPDTPAQSNEGTMDPLDYPSYAMPAFEMEQSKAQPATSTAAATPNANTPTRPAAFGAGEATVKSMRVIATSGFLMKYIASLFAGVSVLCGLSSLGFILLDHFINKPTGLTLGTMFDASTLVSTWHVWLVASLLTFLALYLMLSRAAGKYIADDTVSEREIEVAEVARSIFTAVLVVAAAYLVASLLFTLLNSTLAAAEIEGKDIAIQVAGSVLAFTWIGVIIKHQSTVHLQGKNGVAGIVLAVSAVTVAVLAAVFLLAAGRNAVIDSRALSDLTTIQSKLSSYKSKNDTFPETLAQLTIDDEKVKSRLSKYTYTRTESLASSSFMQRYDDTTSSDSESLFSTTRSFNLGSSTNTGYKLCAHFLTDASSKSDPYSISTTEATGRSSATFYSHGKGEYCVERDI